MFCEKVGGGQRGGRALSGGGLPRTGCFSCAGRGESLPAAVDKTACAAWPEVGRKQTGRGKAGCQVKELEI